MTVGATTTVSMVTASSPCKRRTTLMVDRVTMPPRKKQRCWVFRVNGIRGHGEGLYRTCEWLYRLAASKCKGSTSREAHLKHQKYRSSALSNVRSTLVSRVAVPSSLLPVCAIVCVPDILTLELRFFLSWRLIERARCWIRESNNVHSRGTCLISFDTSSTLLASMIPKNETFISDLRSINVYTL